IKKNGKKVLYNSYGELIDGADALVIDISKWNGNINWDVVKKDGLVDKVILRCGYYSHSNGHVVIDSQFIKNAKDLERLNIPYGVYFFSYATNAEQAKTEAYATLELIKDR